MAESKKSVSEIKIKDEFLILKVDKNPKINNAYKLLGLADSFSKAKKMVEELNPSETGRILILEKKAYYERKPAVILNSLNENLISE